MSPVVQSEGFTPNSGQTSAQFNKLSHWGLLPSLPIITAIPVGECSTLTSVKFRALKAATTPDGKVFHSSEASAGVLAAIDMMSAAPDPALDILPALQDQPGIDPDEAILLTAVATTPGSRLLTGDKRCLRAVAKLPLDMREKYFSSIWTVEQILLMALDRYGLIWLREKVCPWRQIDTAIGIVMVAVAMQLRILSVTD
jgi:hypothetical protein